MLWGNLNNAGKLKWKWIPEINGWPWDPPTGPMIAEDRVIWSHVVCKNIQQIPLEISIATWGAWFYKYRTGALGPISLTALQNQGHK